MNKQQAPQLGAKWVRRLGGFVVGAATLLLLVAFGLPLALGLRPPAKTMRLVRMIDLPGHGLAAFADYISLSGPNLYVGYTSQNKLVVVDTQRGLATAAVEGLSGIHGFAADAATPLGFTSNGSENTVGIVSLAAHRLLAKIPGGVDPDAIIDDARDGLIYAADHDGKTATLIDPVSRKPVATVPLGGVAEFAAADPGTSLVYQNLEDTNETVVVDPKRRAVLARYKTAPGDGPTGLALDAANHRLFVVCGNNTLVVLDESDGRRIAALPIGGGVDGVGYDPGLRRIYTANALATMIVIQQDAADHYHVLESVPTPFGGHTLAVDPATHRVYVVSPGFGMSRIAVFEPAHERRFSLQRDKPTGKKT